MTSVFACSEDELVTLCARVSVGAVAAVRIRELLDAGIDWQRFVQAAIHHRVVPLVQRTLSRDFPGSVPRTIADGLSDSCSALARRNLFLTAKLSGIVGQLESDGVRALAYKGPTLAVQAYGSLSLRQFGDLDVLVDEVDYGRARARFEAYGYRMTDDYEWESSFEHPSESVRVDLHRNVTPDRFPVALSFPQLWERREYAPVLQRQVATLRAEDALVILSIQLAKDGCGQSPMRLSKVCDIAELIRSHPKLDWRHVERVSAALGCRRMVEVGTGVAARLLGPMPAGIPIDLAVCARHTRLEEHIFARLFGGADSPPKPLMSSDSFHFRIRERWRDKLYPYVLDISSRLRPNERDFALVRLPESLRYLYYLIRPVRLTRDYLGRLLTRQR